MTRRLTALILVAVLLGGGGCARRDVAKGAGGPVDFCSGYFEYSFFEEPAPDDAGEVEGYAVAMLRVLDRIRTSYRIDLPKGPPLRIPPEIDNDLGILKTRMTQLRDETRAAKGEAAKVRAAVNKLAADEALVEADKRLTDFAVGKCPD